MSEDPSDQQWEVYYSGHVQGVGFRYTAMTVARPLDVSGYVRNLADGRVHLVAEGRSDVLAQLLDQIAEHQDGRIRDAVVERRPATGEYSGFEIR